MKKPVNLSRGLRQVLRSSWFFRFTVALLVAQALWIALSSHYPMAFDENFHVGIIKLYAHHISPFWNGEPTGAGEFGAVARDPSYLYQWLMSFPYRLLSVFTHNQAAIVICLRLLNIGLFAASLPLFRRLLLRTGASRAIVHTVLFIFVLLPVVPLLAAQVNYDNLLLPLVAGILLLTLRVRDLLHRQRLPLRELLLLLTLCVIASLVKYAFLPMFVVIAGYVSLVSWRVHGTNRTFRAALRAGWRSMRTGTRVALLGVLIVVSGMFLERYGVNTLKYHTPIPDCGDVLTIQECSAYGPWVRDYQLNQQKTTGHKLTDPVRYSGDWFYGMWLRTFFAVSGPNDMYQTRSPLPIPALSVIVLTGLSLGALVTRGKAVWRKYDGSVLSLFAGLTVFYVGSLWLSGYKAFRYTGQPVAINGRYLLPVALLVMAIGALSLYELLRLRRRLLGVTTLVILLSFMWGGGAWTYVIRSSDNWYWHNSLVYGANHAVQHVLWPITPGANKPNWILR